MINLYSFFHLNLNFSALNNITEVIDTSYTNLINEIDKQEFEIGIEASGFTLEAINKHRPKIINKINELILNKKIYFIGSGYHQIISPLFSEQFIDFNLKLGKSIYSNILVKEPNIYLVNEQVLNNSIISNYIKYNIFDLIIDNNINIKSLSLDMTNKPGEYKYGTNKINIYWSHSILSQTLQDFVYGKINLDEYMDSLKKIHLKSGFYCFYGSDAETFDYRVKRYEYEKTKYKKEEYKNIFKIIKKLNEVKNYQFINFNQIKKINKKKISLNINTNYPYLIKKQEKYNLSRWVNTSRYDLYLNSLVLFNKKKFLSGSKKYKKQFLYLLTSDLRTHPTDKKIIKSKKLINDLKLKQLKKLVSMKHKVIKKEGIFINKLPSLVGKDTTFKSFKRAELTKFKISNNYYSFHSLIADFKNTKRLTDINEKYHEVKNNYYLSSFKNSIISYSKELHFMEKSVIIKIKFDYNKIDKGYIRFPVTFTMKKRSGIYLSYLSSNSITENIFFKKDTDHEINKYEFFSVNSLIYSTNGKIEISNKHEKIIFENDISFSNIPIFIKSYQSNNLVLFRVYYSLQELDDTKFIKSPIVDFKSQIYIT